MKAWSKQSKKSMEFLETYEYYVAKEEFIEKKRKELANIYLIAYTWLSKSASKYLAKPSYAEYPIWVNLQPQTLIKDQKDMVLLHLDIPEEEVLLFNFDRWAQILNFSYIPLDENDKKRHIKEREELGVSMDAKAFMTPFYPLLREKIEKSWDFLFLEKDIPIEKQVGIIWEVKKEWITKIDT